MSSLVHISSLVVQVRPEQLENLRIRLKDRENLDLAAEDPSGKLVVVLETASEQEIIDTLEELRDAPGVLSVNMVYHHAESAESLVEEIYHEV